jgi:hypothetical protein
VDKNKNLAAILAHFVFQLLRCQVLDVILWKQWVHRASLKAWIERRLSRVELIATMHLDRSGVVLDRFVIAWTVALAKKVISGLYRAQRVQCLACRWIWRCVFLPVNRNVRFLGRRHSDLLD